jgi:Xaa-Pro aminopeptidase
VLVPGRAQAEYILFLRDRDPARETWDGKRAGPEGATAEYGADDAFPIGDIDDILPGLMEQCSRVYYSMGLNAEFDQHVIGWVNTLRGKSKMGVHTPQEFVALDHLLHDMRLFKSRGELSVMRRSAADRRRSAHVRAMQAARPGMYEYEIEGGTAARLPPAWRRWPPTSRSSVPARERLRAALSRQQCRAQAPATCC